MSKQEFSDLTSACFFAELWWMQNGDPDDEMHRGFVEKFHALHARVEREMEAMP